MTTILPASTLTGDKVLNRQGQTLGRIEDVVVNLTSGNLMYAILALEEAPGVPRRYVTVPWPMLEVDTEIKRIVLNVSRRHLEQAPGFDPKTPLVISDPQWREKVSAHFGGALTNG